MATKIRPKVRDAITQALGAGVVPVTGLQHLQVGRANEVNACIKDIDRISDEGSSFRIIAGEYGSGKTFFLHLIKSVALERKLVTVHADMSPERRLVGTGGQARKLYSELVANMATRSRPDGNALAGIIERFITQSRSKAEQESISTEQMIQQQLSPLQDMVSGYDMVAVISAYCRGYESGNDVLTQNAMRWLRGEYTTKTEAKEDLGVRTFIDDGMFFDGLMLLSRFVSIAGFGGLLVLLDEGVNLFKIANTQSRVTNYEMLLRVLNGSLQGEIEHMGFMVGFTPESVYNPRRGLFSYEALASRLAKNQFAEKSGLVDYSQPIISLQSLSTEELFLLLSNIRTIFAGGSENTTLIDDQAIEAFMEHCNQTLGAAYFKTPRDSVRAFVNLLTLLDQYPDRKWTDFINQVTAKADDIDETSDGLSGEEADLREFVL